MTRRTVIAALAAALFGSTFFTFAQPRDPAAEAAHIRSLLASGDVKAAIEAGSAALKATPDSPAILAATGDALLRAGGFENARRLFLRGIELDSRCARCFLGSGRVALSSFRRKTGRAALAKAFELDPADPEIVRAYAVSASRNEDRNLLFEKYLESDPHETPWIVDGMRSTLDFNRKTAEAPPTKLATPYRIYRIPLSPLMSDPTAGSFGVGLHVSFNGSKPVTLLLDSGASGITISANTAARAGIKGVTASELFGIGDHGARASQLAIVDEVKIGDLAIANIPIDISPDAKSDSIDGLIGPDTFSLFQITLDMAGNQMTLTPFPGATGDSDWADYDRTIPEGTNPVQIIQRHGHMLLIPAGVNGKTAWFALDTGSWQTLIDEKLARTITEVASTSSVRLRGLSGLVNNVYLARQVDLRFGHFEQRTHGMIAISFAPMNRVDEFELSGLIGWTALRPLTVSINYRDGIVDFAPSASKH